MSSYYQLTRYPNIFRGSYWGNFTSDPIRYNDIVGIFQNRNRFVEQFQITKRLSISNTINTLLKTEFNDLDKLIREKHISRPAELLRYIKQSDINSNFYDHIEIYKTTDDRILVLSSPYVSKDEKYYSFLEKTGFINLDYNLYCNSAISFYKIFTKEQTQIPYIRRKLDRIIFAIRNG